MDICEDVAAVAAALVGGCTIEPEAEGSIESVKLAAGDLREEEVDFATDAFAEMPEAVIGITDGGASAEVSVNGDGGRSPLSMRNWLVIGEFDVRLPR